MNLEKILKNDKRIWDEEILDYPQLFELARTYDKELLETLFNNKDSKEKFFLQVGDSHVFKYNEFRFYLEENQVNNSFTQYANKIGLASQGEHLSDSTDYVLDWPYKDCVLEGGMSSEEDTDTFIEKKVETTPGKIDKKTGTVISPEKTEVTFSQAKRKREEVFYNNIIADKEIDRLLDKKALKNFTRYTAKGEEKVKEIKRDEDGTIKENLLIKGNNLLALHSLKEQFAGKVKLIYIDPPYNTGNDGFVYNDRFNHSTWLTFMKNRLEVAKELLREDGVIFVSIDHNEVNNLSLLMEQVFGKEQRVGLITVVNNKSGRSDSKFIATSNEFLLVFAKNTNEASLNNLPLTDEDKKAYPKKDKNGYYREVALRKTGGEWQRAARPNMYYPIYFDVDSNSIVEDKVNNSVIEIYPVDTKGRDGRWRWGKETFNKQKENLIVRKVGSNYKVYEINRLTAKKGKKPKTVWDNPKYETAKGKTRLTELFETDQIDFDFPKPLELIKDIITISTKENDIVLDFFAGSCTIADALISLDQESNDRKFILIEQMNHLNEIGVPRVQKVLKSIDSNDSFIYFELAEYNNEAKNKIDACKSYKELKKLFSKLTDYYFLNYNVSVKQFNDQILDDKDFQELPLEEQKTLFKALLDNNQLYIPHAEQGDGKYSLPKEDQELTNEFYG